MGRVPYLTILGVLCVGAGCTFLMLGYKTFAPGLYEIYEGLNYSEPMAEYWSKKFADFIDDEAELGKDSYYSPENPNYIIIDSALAGAGIVFLLVVAILSTGVTRENCCQTRTCCQGYAMFVHFTTGIVVLLLLVVFLLAAIVMFAPMMLTYFLEDYCTTGVNKPCFGSIAFGLLPDGGTASTQVCFGDDNLCNNLDDIQRGLVFWVAGGLGAALGMVFVLMSNAANFAHFGDMKKMENEEKYVF